MSTALADRGFAAATVHGDLGQAQRERALRAFRSGKVDVLVATEVAARGIDVDDVTHVINYECPDDEKTYLHRIGRTGRAGRTGVAVTFVDWRDMHRWKLINDALGIGQPEPAETYSTSEHLFTDLSIPPGATGTLPRELRGTRAGLAAEAEEDLGETGRTRSRRRSSGGRPRTLRVKEDQRRHGLPGRRHCPETGHGLRRPTGSGESGEAAEPRAPRRRRRTRGGRELAREAAAEPASPQESAQQAS